MQPDPSAYIVNLIKAGEMLIFSVIMRAQVQFKAYTAPSCTDVALNKHAYIVTGRRTKDSTDVNDLCLLGAITTSRASVENIL